MTQTTFSAGTTLQLTDLDLNFTQLYNLRELISTPGYTAATPKLTLDANGNFAFGGTALSSWLTTQRSIQVNTGFAVTASSTDFSLAANAYLNTSSAWTYTGTAAATRYAQTAGQHQWFIAASGAAGGAITFNQAMTLNGSGDLVIGATTSSNTPASGVSLNYSGNGSTGSTTVAIGHPSGAVSGSVYHTFAYASGTIGSITQNGTTGVAYNTTSDYRLKGNVQPITGSGAFIDALKPCAWTWKVDGTPGSGFLAHEMQAVSPSSVTGTKDAVDADGKPIYQSVEYGSAEVTANVVAELKLLRARVAALEAR